MLTNSGTPASAAQGRHAAFSSSATFSNGTVGLGTAGDNSYLNSTGVVGLHFTLSRECGLDTQYFYSNYHFDQNILLPPGLVNARRQGVRIGFTWRTPVFGHQKGLSS